MKPIYPFYGLTILSAFVLTCFINPVLAQEKKPNILLITIDDLNDWVGYLGGHPKVKTPNMDRLAAKGVAFTNAHVQSPVCNPSRTSFLTGLRPTTTGIYGLDLWFRDMEPYKDLVTLPQYFERNGYVTMSTGKTFHDAFPPKEDRRDGPEFTKWGFHGGFLPRPEKPLVENTGHPLIDWGVYPEHDNQQDDWKVVDWAVEQLKNPPKDKPFFLAVGIRHPHVPLFASQKWFNLYPEDDYLLPLMRGDDRDDIPPFAWYLHWNLPEPRLAWLQMHHEWKPKVRAYLASVSFADMLVGRLLDALEEQGLADNTIVTLLSDHGYHLGTKDITGKNTLWHESTRVPFIFSGPGVAEKGKLSDAPVELLDIFPTLNDLAGLPAKEGLDGHSLVPILKDVNHKRLLPAICTHGPDNNAIMTEQWRFIQYADGSRELYNRKEDKYEWQNLARLDGYKSIMDELAAYLPKSAPPAPGSKTRVIEMIDGEPYWEGEKIPKDAKIPMIFMQYKR
ncbi:sulfatase [Algoriphagus sp.]|uniref:sulfatase n=1 Tax=Algoriphagus sp. TaxID=1872435 RepID=UPI00391C4F52